MDSYVDRNEFAWVNIVLRGHASWKKKSKILKMLQNILFKYGGCKQRNIGQNIADKNGIFWFNEKHIEQGLDHRYLWMMKWKNNPREFSK